VARGADTAKDQSYVLYMLDADVLASVELPLGDLTKDQVRAMAADLGLRTATKPDSQDVCFITSTQGRQGFLETRVELHPGRLVDRDGTEVGTVDAVELVTVGQRRGLGLSGPGELRYAVDVDVASRTVTVGTAADLLVKRTRCHTAVWSGQPVSGPVAVQASAHGATQPADVVAVDGTGHAGDIEVVWHTPARRVASGQSLVFYDGDVVLGGAVVD
jgi:tRNA-specific 2-thiouridylase